VRGACEHVLPHACKNGLKNLVRFISHAGGDH
jgi:hypothetical protein